MTTKFIKKKLECCLKPPCKVVGNFEITVPKIFFYFEFITIYKTLIFFKFCWHTCFYQNFLIHILSCLITYTYSFNTLFTFPNIMNKKSLYEIAPKVTKIL